MSAELETAVARLRMVDGARREGAENVAVLEPPPRARERGRLHVLVEVTGEAPGREEICRELVRAIGEGYFRAPGGVTARLRAGLRAANLRLFRENLRARPGGQRDGSAVCAVLRGDEVYIAQMGPAFACVVHRGELIRLAESEAPPLGRTREVAVRFFHHHVQPGDLILLAGGALADEDFAAALGRGAEGALAALEKLGRDLTAMAIEIVVKRETRERREEREPLLSLSFPRVPHLDLSRLQRRMAALSATVLRGARSLLERLLPEAARPAPVPRPAGARPFRAPLTAERRSALLMGLAIAIPLLVILLVVALYWRTESSRRARFAQLVGQAEQKVELALAEGAEEAARERLLEAQDLLAEAERLRPGGAAASELRRRIRGELDRIERVVRLDHIVPLWQYAEPGGDPGRVILAGIDVYVLDRGLDRVYKHLLDETGRALQQLDVEPILLRQGDQRGSIVVGELVDMVYMAPGGGRPLGQLLVLEEGGSLLGYNPERGIEVLALGGSESWGYPQLLGGYRGNLYILDAGSNQILRYVPTADGYGGQPEGYFAPSSGVDLAGAVDMAIDGHVYVLYADGRVARFLGGQPAPFELSGLHEPLRSPTAIFTDEDAEFVYVADAGNRRIVQLDKEGRFVRQFRPAEGSAFDRLRGLYVDERGGRLFFVSGHALYLADIPTE